MRATIQKQLICVKNKIKLFLDKVEKHPLFSSIVLNVFFLTLVLIFCEIKYETSDDNIMSAIIAGAYGGSPNPHMIYINILWGYFLMPFYYLIPNVSWYLIFQLLLCFFSFTAVTYLLLRRLDIVMGLMLSILFITFFSDDAYIVVQFTKTAILAVMAGSVLFLWALFCDEAKNWKAVIAGGILVFCGTLIRFNTIYIAGGFLLLILFVEFFKLISGAIVEKRRKIIKIILCGAILISAAVGAKWYDTYAYDNDNDYRFFREYGEARANIVDRKDYEYSSCAEAYEQIGLSANDYRLLRTWNFADPEFYNLERLRETGEVISEYQSSLGIDRDQIKQRLSERNYWQYLVLWACVFLLFLSIVFNKKYWWIMFVIATIGCAYIVYFAIIGRLVYRMEYAVFLSMFLTAIYYWDRRPLRNLEKVSDIRMICSIFIVILAVLQFPTYRLNRWAEWIYGEEYKGHIEAAFFNSMDYDGERYRYSVYNENAFAGLQQEILGHPDNFYFLNFSTMVQISYFPYNPFKINEWEEMKNSSYLCGVTVEFPDIKDRMKNYGVENPLQSLTDENVYLIDNYYQEEVFTYIKEHFYPNARMELYDNIDGFQIWKFYSK